MNFGRPVIAIFGFLPSKQWSVWGAFQNRLQSWKDLEIGSHFHWTISVLAWKILVLANWLFSSLLPAVYEITYPTLCFLSLRKWSSLSSSWTQNFQFVSLWFIGASSVHSVGSELRGSAGIFGEFYGFRGLPELLIFLVKARACQAVFSCNFTNWYSSSHVSYLSKVRILIQPSIDDIRTKTDLVLTATGYASHKCRAGLFWHYLDCNRFQ